MGRDYAVVLDNRIDRRIETLLAEPSIHKYAIIRD